MKCPYCGVHYMDDERECPICNKRSPMFGAKPRGTAHNHTEIPADTPTTTCSHIDDQDRSSRRYRDTDKYPSIRHAETAAPNPAPAHESGSAKSTSKQATSSASDWGAGKQKNKGAGAVAAVIVIAIATQFLPQLIAFGTEFVDEVRYSGDSPLHVFESMVEPTPDAPASMPTPSAFLSVNENTDHGITLELDEASSYYALKTPTWEETGTFYCWYNDEDYYYTDAFPQDEYDCYTLSLEISSFSKEADGPDPSAEEFHYYLDAYFPAGDTDSPMTVVASLDPPVWMDDDTPMVFTRK